MRKILTVYLLNLLWVSVTAFAQQPTPPGPNPNSQYRLGPDSLPQEGVPKGEIRGPYTLPSQAYPGTQHTYWVYVPAQYDAASPAALMVFQDGHAFMNETGDIRAQNVMDNLIYRREIPVMIGVFINPGRTPEQPEPDAREWGDRTTNRPTEYNTLDDKYARVITEELLPALDKEYNISKDPEMRGIGGSSSGAIAAFTVAWERPNHFRKVLSNVGSFVNLRGGHVYPEKVLASERKPIRVYLCDGRNDNRGLRNGVYDEKRDWFYQNVRLMKALTQKGYDVNYSWSMNLHGQKYGGMIMPEMMRWLWRDGQVSTDVNDMVERSFRQPAASRPAPPQELNNYQSLLDAWNQPVKPFQIIGNIYYVGTNNLACYIIKTNAGLILLDTAMQESGPILRANIEALGFKLRDIKIMLSSHAHFDHVAGHADMKAATGAKVYATKADAEILESGGRKGFHPIKPYYKLVKVDEILADGATVRLGDVVMTAHLTPGHTEGNTAWTMTVEDNGKQYNVVFTCSMSINPGVRMVNNPTWAGVADAYAKSFQILKALPCDVFLGPHAPFFAMAEKVKRLGAQPNPFIDPQGFRNFIEANEKNYHEQIKRERESR